MSGSTSMSASTASPSERPIIFGAPMVRAILAGRKTQTRRVVRLRRDRRWMLGSSDRGFAIFVPAGNHAISVESRCPYGVPGDRLWVRETFICGEGVGGYADDDVSKPTVDVVYRADDGQNERTAGPWTPSIYMPRWASRITLEVTGVRVERLQAISEEDARAEGIDPNAPIPARINGKPGEVHCFGPDAARQAFAILWNGINGDRAPWSENPWVRAISFKVVTP